MEVLTQIVLNSIIAGAIYALMALGFNLIYGVAKFFNLAHGVAASIGGYAAYFLSRRLGLDAYLCAIVAVGLAGACGYAFDFLVYLPLRRKKSSNMILLVASLGIMTLVQSVIAMLFSSQFQTLGSSVSGESSFSISGGMVTKTQIVIFVSGMLILSGLYLLLKLTMFGKSIVAISDDEEVARVVGINTDRAIGCVFFIGSAIAGLAGVLVGYDTGIEPTMGMALLLKGVIASIIGGMGNIYGGVLGSFLLGFAENFGIWKMPGQWKDAISFVLLIVFLIFRPSGIVKR